MQSTTKSTATTGRAVNKLNIEYSNKAVKVIETLDKPTKNRLRQAILNLPNGDVKRLVGKVITLRLRVGDWRVLFSYKNNDTILIEKIAPRGQAYKEG